jgi:hypothetical protein
MRTGLVLVLGLFAACGGDDDYQPPPGGGGGPDAMPGPDAASGPDADPTAPDAAFDGDAGTNDEKGPTFALVSPDAPGTLVRGTITFTVEITDPDTVDAMTVDATITGLTLDDPIVMTRTGTDQWSGTYDTRPLVGRVFPVITVRAKDKPGNENRFGFEIALDNNPPVAELDPPRIRESQIEQRARVCSNAFDPVGTDAADDLEQVKQLIELRARIVDRSNGGPSNTPVAIPMAGVDDARVELFVLDDTTQPLVVNTATTPAGNPNCDTINPRVVPRQSPRAPGEAVLIHMVPLDGEGASEFSPNPVPPLVGAEPCGATGNAGDPPTEMCFAADATRIPTVSGSTVPMIYTIPADPDLEEDACMGFAFDALSANFAEGWACAAIRVADGLGNVSVSPPLRLCVDIDGNGTAPCPAPAPSCRGTLTLPDTVDATACTFATSELFPRPASGFEVVRID